MLPAEAWIAGSFFPRLYDPVRDREPEACRFCEVAQACLRGDSGARRGLVAWAGRAGGDGAIRALRDLWTLGRELEKPG